MLIDMQLQSALYALLFRVHLSVNSFALSFSFSCLYHAAEQ